MPGRGHARFELSFVSVGVWWLVFSIPLFRTVPEPPRRMRGRRIARRQPGRGRFAPAHRDVPRAAALQQAFLMLVAFLIYNDGIQTIIRMATTYGARSASTRAR